LIAEVRAAFEDSASAALVPLAAAPAAPAAPAARAAPEDPVAAARLIVERVLKSLPATFEPQSMSAALARADAALRSGVQNALGVVGAWPDVTPAVVDAAKEAAALALQLIAGEPLYPSWPLPEWVGLAPALRRLWRRRRALGRALNDPDYDINAQRATLDELG
jgi:hypothetical protein